MIYSTEACSSAAVKLYYEMNNTSGTAGGEIIIMEDVGMSHHEKTKECKSYTDNYVCNKDVMWIL